MPHGDKGKGSGKIVGHPGQVKATLRKQVRRLARAADLVRDAANLGISVDRLKAGQFAEVQRMRGQRRLVEEGDVTVPAEVVAQDVVARKLGQGNNSRSRRY